MSDDVYLSNRARFVVLGAGFTLAITSVLLTAGVLRVDGGTEAEPTVGSGQTRMEQLDLDTEQRRAWVDTWRAHRREVLPALDEVSGLRADLRQELAREAPDAETVGRYVIEIEERMKSVGAAREELDASLKELLDANQRAQYATLKAASRRAG